MPEMVQIGLRSIFVVLVIGGVLFVFTNRVKAVYADRPNLKFRRQVLQLCAVLLAILTAILSLPLTDDLRGHLLSLMGLVISATIALSSTTLVGNMMAGIMLKTVGNFKPGDYVTVGDHFGRVTEMDLLHTEIQTEQRDLTTLPNLFLVTNPVRVMHTSGTILSVDLSLGYDVPRHTVETLLMAAATDTGLDSPYVQIRELGDFSISYSISGLLKDVGHVLSKRRELRAKTIDALHVAGVEIASPAILTTRTYPADHEFIPEQSAKAKPDEDKKTSVDRLVFDKAEKAESLSRLKENLIELEARIPLCEEAIVKANNESDKEAAVKEHEALLAKIERLKALIAAKEVKISE